jgi:hypothetical protein
MGRSLKTIITLTTVLLLLFLIIPDNSSAFPCRIRGYLKDAEGNPIPHATITVTGTIYNVTTGLNEEINFPLPVYNETAYPMIHPTDVNGYFRVSFDVNHIGFTSDALTLSYSDGERSVSRIFTTGINIIWLNLTVESGFSAGDFLLSPPGMALIVIIVFVMIVAVYWFKTSGKKEEDIVEESKQKVGRRRK